MTLDLIALCLMAVFVLIGAWRGALASGSGVVTLVLAYGAAAVGAQHAGGRLAEALGVPALLGSVLAASAIFLLTFVACGVASFALKAWAEARRGDMPRSWLDRTGGALFGALRGGLVVLLLSVLLTWLDAARDHGVMPGLEALPDTGSSWVGEAAGELVERVVEASLADAGATRVPAARMMARLAARPGPTLESMQSLLENDRVRALQSDALFWTLVEHGAGERAINQASFYGIVNDPALRAQMAELGLVPAAAAADPALFRAAMAEMLSELGPRLEGLGDDPELARLARDPEVVALLEAGDTFALISHPGIQRVVSRFSGQP